MKAKPRKPCHVPLDSEKGMPLDSFCAMDGETLVLNILGEPLAKRDAIGKPKGKQLQVRSKRGQSELENLIAPPTLMQRK